MAMIWELEQVEIPEKYNYNDQPEERETPLCRVEREIKDILDRNTIPIKVKTSIKEVLEKSTLPEKVKGEMKEILDKRALLESIIMDTKLEHYKIQQDAETGSRDVNIEQPVRIEGPTPYPEVPARLPDLFFDPEPWSSLPPKYQKKPEEPVRLLNGCESNARMKANSHAYSTCPTIWEEFTDREGVLQSGGADTESPLRDQNGARVAHLEAVDPHEETHAERSIAPTSPLPSIGQPRQGAWKYSEGAKKQMQLSSKEFGMKACGQKAIQEEQMQLSNCSMESLASSVTLGPHLELPYRKRNSALKSVTAGFNKITQSIANYGGVPQPRRSRSRVDRLSNDEHRLADQVLRYVLDAYISKAVGDLVDFTTEPAADGGDPAPSKSTPGSDSAATPSSNGDASKKRRRGHGKEYSKSNGLPRQDGDEPDSDDDEDSPKRNKGKVAKIRASGRRLRCPFYSNDPEKYGSNQACSSGLGFPDMSKLMQHIKRAHLQPQRCPRCQASMKSQRELTAHLRQYPVCKLKIPPKDDRISQEDWETMNDNRPRDYHMRSIEEKWTMLYKSLFPKAKRIPSPYDKPVMLHQLEDLLTEAFEEELSKRLDVTIVSAMSEIKDLIPVIMSKCKNRLIDCEDVDSDSVTVTPDTYDPDIDSQMSHTNGCKDPDNLGFIVAEALKDSVVIGASPHVVDDTGFLSFDSDRSMFPDFDARQWLVDVDGSW